MKLEVSSQARDSDNIDRSGLVVWRKLDFKECSCEFGVFHAGVQ